MRGPRTLLLSIVVGAGLGLLLAFLAGLQPSGGPAPYLIGPVAGLLLGLRAEWRVAMSLALSPDRYYQPSRQGSPFFQALLRYPFVILGLWHLNLGCALLGGLVGALMWLGTGNLYEVGAAGGAVCGLASGNRWFRALAGG
ncbi:MAG: hypothetical protein ACR2M0_04560 [Chloroflexia bacterium]